MATSSTKAREHMAAHFKAVIRDTEELLKATAGQAGDKIQTVRSQLEGTLNAAKDRIMDLEHEAVEKVQEGARATDKYVHTNPWASVGFAVGIGLVVGWILGRK